MPLIRHPSQRRLAEDAIKNGTMVETLFGVIDTATFWAKEDLDGCIHHLQSAQSVDRECLLETLRMSRDRGSVGLGVERLDRDGWFGDDGCGCQGYSFGDLESASADGMGGVWPE